MILFCRLTMQSYFTDVISSSGSPFKAGDDKEKKLYKLQAKVDTTLY